MTDSSFINNTLSKICKLINIKHINNISHESISLHEIIKYRENRQTKQN